MKKSELSIIAVIIIVALAIAYFVGNAILGSMTQKGKTIQTISKISSKVTDPDPTVFNSNAKNPTVQINIGDSSNQQPLSGGQ